MIFKIIMAFLTGGAGWGLWRQAKRWEAKGEIPSEWNDGFGPVQIGDRQSKAFLIFHRALGALAWLFCALCVVSLVFFPDI